MTPPQKHAILNYCVAVVWIGNGLFCKVLNMVPRHEQIVARILGEEHAHLLTILIGFLEIGMAIWILSNIWPGANAIMQILIIAVMNTMEFFLVPDLLLWGSANAIFALLFMLLIYYNQFVLKSKLAARK